MSNDIDIKQLVKDKTKTVSPISVGITWVDGRILFKPDKKYALTYYGICHYSDKIFLITPLDWDKATFITTIMVDPYNLYCERSSICLNFKCFLNKFDVGEFGKLFNTTSFTLGLPRDVGTKPLWFNDGNYKQIWKDFVIKPNGGTLKFNEEKAKKDLII